MILVDNPRGDYQFLPGGYPYSSGVVAMDGFAVVHRTLERLVAYRDGFTVIDAELRAHARPRQALCAVELRCPAPYTRAGFAGFNCEYRALLEEWDLLVQGENPIARTNVAPAWVPPVEPALHGFSFTLPCGEVRKSFVVAGAGELRGGPVAEAQVVRPGDISLEGMREKAGYVMNVMARRLAALGCGWDQVSVVNLYTIRSIEALLGPVILDGVGPAARHGFHWYPARPPIDELDFEMDLRDMFEDRLLAV